MHYSIHEKSGYPETQLECEYQHPVQDIYTCNIMVDIEELHCGSISGRLSHTFCGINKSHNIVLVAMLCNLSQVDA